MSFFFFSYFADVFNSSKWTDLQAAVPQDDDVLSSLANSLPDVALAGRAPSTSSIPPPTTDGSLGREIMACLLFLHLLFTLPFISVI